MAKRPLPSKDSISQRFVYDPESGVFKIKMRTPDMYKDTEKWTAEQLCNSFNARLAGRTAGTKLGNGYIKISVSAHQILAHRAAFIIMGHPVPNFVDHINGIKDDNRWVNLRACDTQQENTRNRRINNNSTSGFTGITRRQGRKNTWEAAIKVNEKAIYLGSFACLADAIRARLRAEIDLGFFLGSERREKAVALLRL